MRNDDELFEVLTTPTPSSAWLAVIKRLCRNRKSDPRDALILERLLMYAAQGETVLLTALGDLLGTDQEHLLSLIDYLERAQLLRSQLILISKKGDGLLVHLLGTRQLVEALRGAMNDLAKDRQLQIQRRLTPEEQEFLKEDGRLAVEAARHFPRPAGARGSGVAQRYEELSKAIDERQKRFAEAKRRVAERKQTN